MTDSKIRNLKREVDTWLRTLNYMQEENIFLKNSLANTIKENNVREALDHLESFQNQFLNKDTILVLLRHDIIEQCKLLENEETDIQEPSAVAVKQDKLRLDMSRMEKDFNFLKGKFNGYLANVI